MDTKYNGLEVAVIGISLKVPGSENVNEFWDNLTQRKETITYFTDNELIAAGVPLDLIQDSRYVKANGIIGSAHTFDSSLFHYTPEEINMMHPQTRKLHECIYEALEDAGYNSQQHDGEIGIYAGLGSSSLWEYKVACENESIGKFASPFFSDKDFAISKLAYCFNLKGPNINVKTACSTSMVAIHLACRALQAGECDMAVAGGATISYGNRNGYLYEDGGVYAKDGHCRPFDVEASGTVPGDGVGVVILKLLENAIQDGDHIYAVVKGSSISGDGNKKVAYTAPSVDGETKVISDCVIYSDVDPKTISFVEAHGTGTQLGDLVEVEALNNVYGDRVQRSIVLGSVKGNVGHLDSASGVVSFIKTVLCLYHKKIVPTANFKQANPKLHLENTPFWINEEVLEWKSTNDVPRRAGVSSFGIGGTNVHAILEEYEYCKEGYLTDSDELLLLSAENSQCLERLKRNYEALLEQDTNLLFGDIAYTLQAGRQFHSKRLFVVASSKKDAAEKLRNNESCFWGNICTDNKRLVFMFPGQGIQYENIAIQLYQELEEFRIYMDDCFNILEELGYGRVKKTLYPNSNTYKQITNEYDLTSIINFIIGYSMGKLLMKIGLQPDYLVGHSIGEYVAACLAGVFSLEDALKIIIHRGLLMNQLPKGRMLAVPIQYNELGKYLEKYDVSIAANHGYSCLVSGTEEAIEKLKTELLQQKIICQLLDIHIAGHSDFMRSIQAQLEGVLDTVELHRPNISIVSTVTGKKVVDQMETKEYWIEQMLRPVLFAEAIQSLMEPNDDKLFLELGAGNVLSRVVQYMQKEKRNTCAFNMLKYKNENVTDINYLLKKIGFIWLNGGKIDWNKFVAIKQHHRVSICTYPFDDIPHPYDEISFSIEKLKKKEKRKEFKDWFYIPVWKRKLLDGEKNYLDTDAILVFGNKSKVCNSVEKRIRAYFKQCIFVAEGDEFRQCSENEYEITPGKKEDFISLFDSLEKKRINIKGYVFLWALHEKKNCELELETIYQAEQKGLLSFVHLLNSRYREECNQKCNIVFVTNDVQKVNDSKVLYPEYSSAFGAINIIPAEVPNFTCKSIDVSLEGCDEDGIEELSEQLFREILVDSEDIFVSYRNHKRFVKAYEQIEVNKLENELGSLENQKVYVIVGGFGGIGYEIIKDITTKIHCATFIVLGRNVSSLEERKKVIEIHENQLVAYSVDISKEEEIKNTFKQIYQRYKEINGVFFCASENDGGLLCNYNQELLKRVFAAKVYGSILICKYVKKETLDFLFFCSSVNVIKQSVGTLGYTSANMFVDAYSDYLSDKYSLNVKCINWFAWREVGGAVKHLRTLVSDAYDKRICKKYPDLDCDGDIGKRAIFRTCLSFDNWVISEHKVNEVGTMPGTGYLDLIANVIRGFYHMQQFELCDVYFMKMLQLASNEVVVIEVTVEAKSNNEYTFLIESIREGKRVKHALGVYREIKNEQKKIHFQEEIESTFLDIETFNNKENLQIGNRWLSSIKGMKIYDNKTGLIVIGLEDIYLDDLATHSLHPALLDISLATYNSTKYMFIPFYYESIKVYDKLSNKLVSNVKMQEKNENSMSYDYVITDQEGTILMEVKKYMLAKGDYEKAAIQLYDEEYTTQQDEYFDIINDLLKDGLSNEEGLNVFHTFMDVELEHVLICPIDIEEEINKKDLINLSKYDNISHKSLKERQINTIYEAPKSEIEKKVVEIWEKILGIKEIGINDNYFDLGANSLNILQVNQFVQQELKLQIPVVNYYVYPTIKSFVDYLNIYIKDETQIVQAEDEIVINRKNLTHRRRLLD